MNCIYMKTFLTGVLWFATWEHLSHTAEYSHTHAHIHRESFKGRSCHTQRGVFFFRGVGQVMDPSCPGRESVCLGMMKSSTCPHSSSPLHILIITNLQTYSRGHTHTHTQTKLPPLALSQSRHHSLRPTPELKFNCGGQILMLVVPVALQVSRVFTEDAQMSVIASRVSLTVEMQSYRSHQGPNDFLVTIWCLELFGSE